MTAEERIVWLEEQLRQALEQVQALQEQLAAAKLRIEELEKQKTPVLATWDIRSKTCALTMNFTHLFSTLSA